MEIWEAILPTVMGVIIFSGLILLYYLISSNQNERIYVYTKTGSQYFVKGEVLMKDTESGGWVEAILYVSQKKGYWYVREKRQFFDKFITLKEWRKNNGNSKS